MPVRHIPNRTSSVAGLVAGGKSIGKGEAESTLEADLLTLLEYREDVIDYEVQPVDVRWVDAHGKRRGYVPDIRFRKLHRDRIVTILGEVKPVDVLRRNWAELRPRFMHAVCYARNRGWIFKIFTEKRIRTEELRTAKFLLSYRFRQEIDPNLEQEILRAAGRPRTIRALLGPKSDANRLATIWTLLARHQLRLRTDLRLTMDSVVWRS
jgi:hypothetical protein